MTDLWKGWTIPVALRAGPRRSCLFVSSRKETAGKSENLG